MKKLFFAIGMAAITVGSFSSCKKCTTCEYSDLISGERIITSEYCTKSDKLDKYESDFETANVGQDPECIRK